MRSITELPLVLKGICHPEDVRRARDGGVDGIYCSNHGGRQANGGLPDLEALPGVVALAKSAYDQCERGSSRPSFPHQLEALLR